MNDGPVPAPAVLTAQQAADRATAAAAKAEAHATNWIKGHAAIVLGIVAALSIVLIFAILKH